MFGRLVLVGPSARYIDDVGYVGGFSEKQIAELLEFLEDNHMGWSAAMAPSIMGNPGPPRARRGAHQQFLPYGSGDRQSLRAGDLHVRRPRRPAKDVRAMILQCKEDIIASTEVGEFVHDQIRGSKR
jgi:sigma-B regulation protein RsbQ